MNITRSNLFPDVCLITPPCYQDERGFFMETFRESWLADVTQGAQFVQDNHSYSKKGVLRGMHYQLQQVQGKLVRVVRGQIFDVVVDMRKTSATFGQWQGFELSADNRQQLWVPPGFAHGFYVVSEEADCLYRCTDYYHAASERSLLWNDPDIGIEWPITGDVIISDKDKNAVPFKQAETF